MNSDSVDHLLDVLSPLELTVKNVTSQLAFIVRNYHPKGLIIKFSLIKLRCNLNPDGI